MAETIELPARDPSSPLLLGVDELGREITWNPTDPWHVACQGQTRSGKSTWCYSLLAQLAARPDALIAGSDISELLLRKEIYADTEHDKWQARGDHNLEEHPMCWPRSSV